MKRLGTYSVLLVGALIFAYPFLWMLAASFKPEAAINGLALWSNEFTTTNYEKVLVKIPILRAFLNSLIVSACTTASVVVFGSMVGYALSRLTFIGRRTMYLVILFTMMIPFQIVLIPQYILMVKLGWTDTYLSLIAPTMLSAFGIVLFRQFFAEIPQALIDAARIDGCSELAILFRIIWPLSRPVLITVALLTFMTNWNEVLWPMMVVRDRSLMTMPQVVALFSTGGEAESQLGYLLAAATLLAAPVVIAYAFFQRYFIESMASTGLKG